MSAPTEIKKVAVYCGSSRKCSERYFAEGRLLGRMLAESHIQLVYGGGAAGTMGALADGVLQAGGAVTGVIPEFMVEVEWGNEKLSDLRTVNNMHERKKLMLELADAVVALPGGCGTLEELMEAVTWKQLGLFTGPIVIVNQDGYYDPLLTMLRTCIHERFMNTYHETIWQVTDRVSQVFKAFETSNSSGEDALLHAQVE
ncbi:MAG: TIGR00730 family Rossman fold protein [Candidatus Latescibacterota bacterium]|nr:TIGR00730 family Rossman fold protein [Candidatus Latescibacterota bacterium]